MKNMKEKYEDIKIPNRLDQVVNETIRNFEREKNLNKNMMIMKRLGIGTTAAAMALTLGINTNQVFAENLESIPVVGGIVKVINFQNYTVNDGNKNADINVPNIQGLKNNDLQLSMNNQFIEDGKALYNKIIDSNGKISINSNFKIITDNDKYLTIKVETSQVEASGCNTVKYYTIDKEKQCVLTLEGLFEGTNYVDVISSNIKEQMREQMKNDKNKLYFIDDENIDNSDFEKIDKNQNFYINNNGEIVISFDEYEVAPGYMGVVEFTIPNSVINSIK